MIRIPDLALPAVFAAIGARLPRRPPAVALAVTLNAAVGRRFLQAEDLEPLTDRPLRVNVADAGIVADIAWDGVRFVALKGDDVPAVAFTASVSAFLQMLTRQEDPDTLFFNRRLAVEGDTELGLLAKNLLDRVALPEWLSSRLGSVRDR